MVFLQLTLEMCIYWLRAKLRIKEFHFNILLHNIFNIFLNFPQKAGKKSIIPSHSYLSLPLRCTALLSIKNPFVIWKFISHFNFLKSHTEKSPSYNFAEQSSFPHNLSMPFANTKFPRRGWLSGTWLVSLPKLKTCSGAPQTETKF